MAPEMFLNQQYTEAVDVWGLGVVLYYLMSLELPFVAPTPYLLGQVVTAGKFKEIEGDYSVELKDLLSLMLQTVCSLMNKFYLLINI
jgi:serine/threonine protein kinase